MDHAGSTSAKGHEKATKKSGKRSGKSTKKGKKTQDADLVAVGSQFWPAHGTEPSSKDEEYPSQLDLDSKDH
ncbi:hypothetical protein DL767_008304 [Monosporascus sp. MG133]|nr:hypothetical protein DL767_008304 [Monosporascus sp. MG133]